MSLFLNLEQIYHVDHLLQLIYRHKKSVDFQMVLFGYPSLPKAEDIRQHVLA